MCHQTKCSYTFFDSLKQRYASADTSLKSLLDDEQSKAFFLQVLHEEHEYLRQIVERGNDIDPSIPRSDKQYDEMQATTAATMTDTTIKVATMPDDLDSSSLVVDDNIEAQRQQLDALLSLQSPPPSQQASTQPPPTPPIEEQIRQATSMSQRNPIVERENAINLLGVWHRTDE